MLKLIFLPYLISVRESSVSSSCQALSLCDIGQWSYSFVAWKHLDLFNRISTICLLEFKNLEVWTVLLCGFLALPLAWKLQQPQCVRNIHCNMFLLCSPFSCYKSASWNCSSGKSWIFVNSCYLACFSVLIFRSYQLEASSHFEQCYQTLVSFVHTFKRWTCCDKFGRPSKTKMYEAKFQQSTLVLTNLQRQLLN